MARMPGARWLGEHSPKKRMERYDVVCIHTIVGRAPAHAAHFSVHGDGTIDQSRDTAYRSAANLDGNHRVIAIENEDMGPDFGPWPDDDMAPPLTPAQIESNAQILAWAHKTHGVPLQLCPDSRPGSRGLAYHRQGIDGNWSGYRFGGRVSGGEVWTESRGKVCPTDSRIAQRPAILARAIEIVNGEDDDMPSLTDFAEAVWDHKKALTRTFAAVWNQKIGSSGKSGGTLLLETAAKTDVLLDAVKKIPGVDTTALAAQLTEAVAKANAEAIVDELSDRLDGE